MSWQMVSWGDLFQHLEQGFQLLSKLWLEEVCVSLHGYGSPHHHWPTTKLNMLNSATGRLMFSTDSPHPWMSVMSFIALSSSPGLTAFLLESPSSWDAGNLFAMQRIEVLEDSDCSSNLCRVLVSMLPVLALTLAKCKSNEKTEKMRRAKHQWALPVNHSCFLWLCYCYPCGAHVVNFINTKAAETGNPLLFNRPDQLTWCCALIKRCSFNFLSSVYTHTCTFPQFWCNCVRYTLLLFKTGHWSKDYLQIFILNLKELKMKHVKLFCSL